MNSVMVMALAVVVCAAIAISLLKRRRTSKGDGRWPLHARKPLSVPEQVLYFRLIHALPGHIVLAQVSLSRVLKVDRDLNKSDAVAWHNRIARMTADFVVCAKDSSVVAVIELDDATHERADRKVADEKKERALTAAGIHVIRWRAKLLPDEAAIRRALPRNSRDSRQSAQLAQAA
jgi:very-short-patch-repair endonuclease